MMPNTHRYTYRAEWSLEDDEYVGLVAEFPSLSWLAPTAGEAIAGAERLVAEVLVDMEKVGEVPPVPLTERRYSGNISFRTSPDHHRRLAIAAAEQGVSINQWMVQRLSAAEPALPAAVLEVVQREVREALHDAAEQAQEAISSQKTALFAKIAKFEPVRPANRTDISAVTGIETYISSVVPDRVPVDWHAKGATALRDLYGRSTRKAAKSR